MTDLTDLLNPFEKLIVEHGSAVVQKHHLDYLRERLSGADKQVAALERDIRELHDTHAEAVLENTTLGTRVSELTHENILLASEVRNLQSAMEKLEVTVRDQEQQINVLAEQVAATRQQKPQRHPEECERILQLIADGTENGMHFEALVSESGLTRLRVRYNIDKLNDDSLVDWSVGDRWHLSSRGRKYIVENGLH